MGWWKRKERDHDLARELQAALELEAMEQQEESVSRQVRRRAQRIKPRNPDISPQRLALAAWLV